MHITQSLHMALQRDPNKLATVFGARQRTFAESVSRISRFAGALESLGLQPGDRVGIYALNSDRYHELLMAVPWADGVVNPVNVRWSLSEVAYSLVDCQTDVLVVDDAFAESVPALRAKAPNLKTIIFCGEGATPEGMHSYEDLVASSPPALAARRGNDDVYGVFYTGGTTGYPKGVMISHRACLVSAMGSLVTTDILTRGGRLLHAAPMFHLADIAAWNICNLTGSTHVIIPSFTPAGVLDAIAEHRVTDALLVPTMIQLLVDSPLAATADVSSLVRVMYGASPIAESVLRKARKVLVNARFNQAYGMTELAPIATILTAEDHDDPALIRSCGRPAAHSEVLIVDPADVEVPRGEVGEIIVRGDHLMVGYWNKPQESATAMRGGWMHTGDAAYMDDQGYVFIVDRIKDMIVTGGENVYSAEVENAVANHPAVAQVAVIGIPDADWGERVHAVIVLVPGETVTEQELRQFCRESIAGYKVPRTFEFAQALPISGAGKILKRELRKDRLGNSVEH